MVREPTVPEAITDLAGHVKEAADRIRQVVVETPVERIEGLAPDGDVEVFFKLENLQKTGSFKLRGASNKILSLSPEQAQRSNRRFQWQSRTGSRCRC